MFFNISETSLLKISSGLIFSIHLINSCIAQSASILTFSEFTKKKIWKLKQKKIIIRSGKKTKYVYFVSTVNMYTFVYEKDET